jgi:hypothetical protein
MSLISTQEEFAIVEKLAKYAAESKHFQNIGGVAGAVCIIQYAKGLGINPLHALYGGMRPVMGKIEIAPQQMNAMIRKAGHRIDIVECNNEKCVLKGTRKDTGETCTLTFSIEDAKRAGIYKENSGWTKYPSDMLFARAISRLCRRLFPDVTGCTYAHGEISGVEDKLEEVDVIEEEQKPIVVQPELSLEEIIAKKNELIAKLIEVTGMQDDEYFIKGLERKEKCCIETKRSYCDELRRCIANPQETIAKFNEWKKSLPVKKEVNNSVAA